MSDLAVAVPVATVWTGPEAPREIDASAVRDAPDVDAWAQSMDVVARQGLHGRTLTQALLGEPVDVVTEHGDWVEVVLPWQPSATDPRGYPGWIRRAHLDSAPQLGAATVVVTAATARMDMSDGSVLVSFGTRLPVRHRSEHSVTIETPGSRTGSLSTVDVQLYRPDRAIETPALMAAARQFLGLHYLWGGTSAWGLDCSGFVHLIHRTHGVTVRRDAYDQHEQARPVPLDHARTGDLYFFARPGARVHHVGFVTNSSGGPRAMLHAPESGKRIEDAPLAPHRLGSLLAAGRLLPHPPRGVLRVT